MRLPYLGWLRILTSGGFGAVKFSLILLPWVLYFICRGINAILREVVKK